MKLKVIFASFLFMLALGRGCLADESLRLLISQKQWTQLPSLFGDNSYQILADYFSNSQSIKFITTQSNRLTYKAKFTNRGEIGVITYERQDGKFSALKIENQIKPIYFVEKFRKYRVSRAQPLELKIGDAMVKFHKGFFYQTIPFDSLLMFSGSFTFSIRPGDEEEQLTLRRKFKQDSFSHASRQGIFVLQNRDFLSSLAPAQEVSELDKESQPIFDIYRERYGVKIKQFDEYWYLPFPEETNLIIFGKDPKSYYYYTYNRSLSPDTQLVASDTSNILLSYNSYKEMKLQFGPGERVDTVHLSLFYNPQNSFLSGTVQIRYKTPSNLKVLKLQGGLKLVGNLDFKSKGLNVFRKKNTYYLLGGETDKLSLFFRGSVEPSYENEELFKPQSVALDDVYTDSFYFLSNTQNFFPGPEIDFYKTDVTITLPQKLNCLVSGNLEEKRVENRNIFTYRSDGAKGIALIAGDFELKETLDARIPINIYCSTYFQLLRRIDFSEIKRGLQFFIRKFGSLNVSAINLLLKRGHHEGGVSNKGFIIVSVNPNREKIVRFLDKYFSTSVNSPVKIRNFVEDYILHELSHQWWGGLISWKSFQDVWLTEGLAHFSVLYFLKASLPEKRFKRIIRELKKWIFSYQDAGPVIYGTRIQTLEDSYEAYQSIVYNKSALMFLMLLDLLGEEDFTSRLQSVLDAYKYRSLTSRQFIQTFSNREELLMKFFNNWVYSRKLPEITLDVNIKGNSADILVRQLNTDFVFPLTIEVETRSGNSLEKLVVRQKEQTFTVSKDSTIKSMRLADSPAPVILKK
jgi:hypothetical protein